MDNFIVINIYTSASPNSNLFLKVTFPNINLGEISEVPWIGQEFDTVFSSGERNR